MLQTVTDFKRPFFRRMLIHLKFYYLLLYFSTREENYPYFMMLFGYDLCVCVCAKKNEFM